MKSEIDALPWTDAFHTIETWSAVYASRYICLCNVHSIVTATRDERFMGVINGADMATPDGMPLVWYLRRTGYPKQERISGPDLMWKYCERAATLGHSIFLYGGADNTLKLLKERLSHAFPLLKIAGAYSPPFRTMSMQEDEQITSMINDSGANVVFVGLGCPKQEYWMAEHRGKINAVMIGVGAAFDYHAGTIKRAPKWMQNSGLEWLYRLLTEPRRLWRRYLVTNSIFLYLMCKEHLLMRKNR